MADPISKERLDKLAKQWAGVIAEYPTLQKYGPRPFDETGFDPRAAREYKHLKSRPKPTPEPPVVAAQPQQQEPAPTTAVPGQPQQQQYPDAYMPEAKDQWMSGEYLKDIGSRFARGVGGLIGGAIAGPLTGRFGDPLKNLGDAAAVLQPLEAGAAIISDLGIAKTIAPESDFGQIPGEQPKVGETTTGLIRPIWTKDHGPDPYVLRRYKQLRAMGLGIPQAAYAARQQTQEAGEMSTARQIGTAVVSEGAVPGIGIVGGISKSIPKTAAKLADTVPPTAAASVAEKAAEAAARTAEETVRGLNDAQLDSQIKYSENFLKKYKHERYAKGREREEALLRFAKTEKDKRVAVAPISRHPSAYKRSDYEIGEDEIDRIRGLNDAQLETVITKSDADVARYKGDTSGLGVKGSYQRVRMQKAELEGVVARDEQVRRSRGVDPRVVVDDVPPGSVPDAEDVARAVPEPEGLTRDYFGFERVLETAGRPLGRIRTRIGEKLPWGKRLSENEQAVKQRIKDTDLQLGQIIESQASRFASRMGFLARQHFPANADGTIDSLSGVIVDEYGAVSPTIQDVIARQPDFVAAGRLTSGQIGALDEMRKLADEIMQVRVDWLDETSRGHHVSVRPDVMDGGTYLPRGGTNRVIDDTPESVLNRTLKELFDDDVSQRVGDFKGANAKASFQQRSSLSSQGRGIAGIRDDAGEIIKWDYPTFEQSMLDYARAVGYQARDEYQANYLKSVRQRVDDTNELIAKTDRQLMEEEGIQASLDRLRREISGLKNADVRYGKRQSDAFDRIENYAGKRIDEINFEDLKRYIDDADSVLGDVKDLPPQIEVSGVRGKFAGMRASEIREGLAGLKKILDGEKPSDQNPDGVLGLKARRDAVLEKAKSDRGRVSGVRGLGDVTFHNRWRAIVQDALDESRASASPSGFINKSLLVANNVVETLNHVHRTLGASFDLSPFGINGLLFGFRYGHKPSTMGETMRIAFKSFGDRDVFNRFLQDHDKIASAAGRLTASEWAKVGLHFTGESGEFIVRGKLGRLPWLRASNRSFGNTGDSIRIRNADMELEQQLKSGRTLDELESSGDLERIADAANSQTGFTETRAFNSLGDLALFAPRFLQARMNTVARAGRGAYYGVGERVGVTRAATIEERMSRRSILQMLGYATVLNYGLNDIFKRMRGEGGLTYEDMFGNGGVFMPMWTNPATGKSEPNPNFYALRSPVGRLKMLGTYDSLMAAFIHAAQGNVLKAQSHMASGASRIVFEVLPLSGSGDWQGKPVAPWQEGGDWGDLVEWIADNYVPFSPGEVVSETIEETVPRTLEKAGRGDVIGSGMEIAGAAVGGTLEIVGSKFRPPTRRDRAELARMGIVRGAMDVTTVGDLMKKYEYDATLPGFKDLDLNSRVEWHDLPSYVRLNVDESAAADGNEAVAFEIKRLEEKESFGPRADYYAKVEDAQEVLLSELEELRELSIKDDVSPMKHYREDPGNVRAKYYATIEFARKEAEKDNVFPDYEKRGLRAAEDTINKVLYGKDEDFIKSITGGYEPLDSSDEGFNYDESERRLGALHKLYGEGFVDDMKEASIIKKFPEGHPERERKLVQRLIDDSGYFETGTRAAEELGLSDEWEMYQNMSTPERRNTKRDSKNIRDILARSRKLRDEIRLNSANLAVSDPENPLAALDEMLLKWGYVDISAYDKLIRSGLVTGGKSWRVASSGGGSYGSSGSGWRRASRGR